MKRILLILLALFSLAYADDPLLCNFEPGDEAQESFASAMGLVALAIMLAVLIIALSYMIGTATSNPSLLAFSKDEISHLAITILLTVFLLSFFEGSCHFFNQFLDAPGGAMSISQNYMYNLQVEGNMMLSSLIKSSVSEKFKGARLHGYTMPFTGGEMYFLYSYHNAKARQYEILADMVTMGYIGAGVQYYVLMFVQSFVFPVLLPFGLILRALPFVREAGNVLLALCFSIIIILPFAYAVNASASSITIDAGFCDSDSERVLSGCSGLTGWGSIAAYLFQTIFLPNLAMVVFITGASAMVKAAKVIP